MDEQITISKKEYDQLLHDSRFLNALQRAGVDDWEWYGETLDILENEEKENVK
jgi:hypothetical protein